MVYLGVQMHPLLKWKLVDLTKSTKSIVFSIW
jgi:hypothetical protein